MITEIRVEDAKNWNYTVRSFSDYDVFYLNEYVTAFENYKEKNGVPILLYYENDADRAIYVVFKRDIGLEPNLGGKVKKDKIYDLISPYGYGGWWGQINDYDELNKEYDFYCSSHHYVCEFVRFELFSDYHFHYDGKIKTRTRNVVRNLKIPIDEMWMDFKQNVRKNVKRASKNGLKVLIDEEDHINDHLSEFLRIYYSTMDRTNAEDEYYFDEKFFRKINTMTENVVYFYTITPEDGRIISTELVIYGSENAYSYLGGTDSDYFSLRPNDILKYEIIRWCQHKGLKNYVLGGGYGSDDGIFEYKRHFAPNGVVNFYIGMKVIDEKNYKDLCALRGIDITSDTEYTGFFPKYRGGDIG